MADRGLTVAVRELRRGRLLSARAGLESVGGRLLPEERNLKATALAEILQLGGSSSEARQQAEVVLRDGHAEAVLRSRCLTVVGNLAADAGELDQASARHRQAIDLARKAGDPGQLARSQLRLLSTIADRNSADFVAPSAADVRKNVIHLIQARDGGKVSQASQ